MNVNVHHNYASLEHHYGENVWVHRKGAIRARKDEIGIIPGVMGRNSYIVKGLGDPESFYSCSHGAGRKMGRKEACRQITQEQAIKDLENNNVTIGKYNMKDVAEKCGMSYKDIDFVIDQEKDLITPIKKLKTVLVIKG